MFVLCEVGIFQKTQKLFVKLSECDKTELKIET